MKGNELPTELYCRVVLLAPIRLGRRTSRWKRGAKIFPRRKRLGRGNSVIGDDVSPIR